MDEVFVVLAWANVGLAWANVGLSACLLGWSLWRRDVNAMFAWVVALAGWFSAACSMTVALQ